MQAADLVKYINDPSLLNRQSIGELQKLAKDFPYFQPAHMLLSMASRKWDASVYQQSLKKTAIVATNRAHLFDLIHQVENEAVKVKEEPVKEAIKQEPALEKTEPVKPEAVKENDPVIDATEVPAIAQQEVPVTIKDTEVVADVKGEEKPVNDVKSLMTAEHALEKEIEKQVVNAFVEKELLKTPELHHPKPKAEPESFTEWLLLLKKNNGQEYHTIKEQATEKIKQEAAKKEDEKNVSAAETDPNQLKKQKNKALIDKIIESSPGLIRTKEEQKFYTPDNKAKESLLDNEHLVTETLAKIYALQGSVNKAVRAYEILSLKFPQKSAYFATLIQKLKNNQ